MERVTVVLFGFIASLVACAQPFYLIDSISVTPLLPSSLDNISITTHGTLVVSDSWILGTSHQVNGNDVNIWISAFHDGANTPSAQPHDVSFDIGLLPSGTYAINLTCIMATDQAPVEHHTFVVVDGVAAVPDHASDPSLLVNVVNEAVTISSSAGTALGSVMLVASDGRVVHQEQVVGSQVVIRVKELCAGTYSLWASGCRQAKRIVLAH